MGNPVIDNAPALLAKENNWRVRQIFGGSVANITHANIIFADQNLGNDKAFGINNMDGVASFAYYNATTFAYELTEFQMKRLNGFLAFGLANAGAGKVNVNGYLEKNYILSPCTAHLNMTTISGTPAINASNNVTSITDNGVGDYTVNFTTALANANYAVNITIMVSATEGTNMNGVVKNASQTTSSIGILVGTAGNSRSDQEKVYLSVFGGTA